MKMSGGVEWALHCTVVLSAAERPVPAARLAELHDVSASYLAKQLQALSRAEIIRSVQGHAGGYELARPASRITVLDVVEAVDGPQPAFVCTEIRQRGPLAASAEACEKPCAISRAMSAADQAWRASLRAVTIADLAAQVGSDYDADVFAGVRAWL
ncbi:RrF2 family transcriptional regulator [Paractinoplanes atraurantiacus]|uniref:Rrf2 family protein n=1 Tax=Paractinoplanes atraurantiacus TaxID=1036182 RepID=A0A285IWY3_9ACTN|nr:Rrf2 family transcriptional regulator [Actinoplanes atraurantiacus]SNY52560.1 Rrf2 family protein [Actinoplanes atraurantiacus]